MWFCVSDSEMAGGHDEVQSFEVCSGTIGLDIVSNKECLGVPVKGFSVSLKVCELLMQTPKNNVLVCFVESVPSAGAQSQTPIVWLSHQDTTDSMVRTFEGTTNEIGPAAA